MIKGLNNSNIDITFKYLSEIYTFNYSINLLKCETKYLRKFWNKDHKYDNMLY